MLNPLKLCFSNVLYSRKQQISMNSILWLHLVRRELRETNQQNVMFRFILHKHPGSAVTYVYDYTLSAWLTHLHEIPRDEVCQLMITPSINKSVIDISGLETFMTNRFIDDT